MGVAGILLTTFIVGAVASNKTGSIGEPIADAFTLAPAAALVALALSARVEGTTDRLVLVNLFRRVRIGRREVSGVEINRGLVIVTRDRRLFRSFAYGSSVLGDLIGYPRARKAQRRVEQWLSEEAQVGQSVDGTPEVTLRRGVLFAPLAFACFLVVEVVLVRLLR